MKTAISIPDDLFQSVETLAKESHRSRSQIFSEAVKDYIHRRNNEKILEALNRVYANVETKQETALRKKQKQYYAKSLKAEKW